MQLSMKSNTKIYVMQSEWRPALPALGDSGRSVKYAKKSKMKTKEGQVMKVGKWNGKGTNQQGKT